MTNLGNAHPGEVLLEDFLVPLGISQNALARAAKVPPRRINEIVLGKRSISADTAVRLAVALGTSESLWLKLQADYDLDQARAAIGQRVEEDQPVYLLDDMEQPNPWDLFLEALDIFAAEGVEFEREQPTVPQVREDLD